MSLNWSLKNVADFNALFIPGQSTDNGGWIPVAESLDTFLNPVTEALIWSCMMVELGKITEANAEEFYRRVSLWERHVGPMLNWGGERRYLTLADVKRHVGLSCNVIDRPAKKFEAKLTAAIIRDAVKADPEAPSLLEQYLAFVAANLAKKGGA